MNALPVGIQNFAKLRKGNFIYVDKTKEIYQMLADGTVFFLSRPRRFGKSLLISTLDSIFRGEKELFEGLYIYDKMDWTQQYPVIRIDWSIIKHASAEEMERSMNNFLQDKAAEYQLTLAREYASDRLEELIRLLHQKTGNQVAVLVDEYDMPILDALNKPEETNEIRQFLQSFYKIIKASDEHLRFVFLTGVSKFSKVSIFSGLNNLNDITMDTRYATICGYTQPELENYFTSHIEQLAQQEQSFLPDILERIKHWYNGYSWDGINTVYNPFSTLLLFDKNVFSDYWFATGTPTFLVDLIKKRNDVNLLLEPTQLQGAGFDSFDYQTLDTKLLLFQTGYLTVKQVRKDTFGGQLVYTLGIPNEEVRQSLMTYLVSSFAAYPVSDTFPMRSRMLAQLFEGDLQGFERNLQEMFAGIPYQLHIPREAYYHSLLLLWLNLLGFEVQAEVSTDKGRIDAVWIWENRVVITEVKFSVEKAIETLVEDAFAQIHKRRYYERYIGSNKRVALLAIAFTGKEVACRMNEL